MRNFSVKIIIKELFFIKFKLDLDLSIPNLDVATQRFRLHSFKEKTLFYETEIRNSDVSTKDYFAWNKFKFKVVWLNTGSFQ